MRQSDWSKIHTLMQRSDWCEQQTTLHVNIELFFEIFLDNLSPLDFRYARRGKKIKLKAFRKPLYLRMQIMTLKGTTRTFKFV